jgi:hypothetical protein
MTVARPLSLAALALVLVFSVPAAHGQTWALGDTLTVIQKPLLNIPDIVVPGAVFRISCDADPSVTGWTAALERGGFSIPLELQSAQYDPQTLWWALDVVVPEVPVHDLYDLRLTADGGIDDVTRQAVKVQPAYPDEFYFVHITDTHLPTYLYYYQSGADTDSSTTISLRHITQDVNIINPAFVLLTGDFINEGELEDFLGKRYYSRAQRQLTEFEVPVFLTSGNHDIGGWNDTPPPAGTARRDWWRFFGWKRLDDPPAAVPQRTQNFSFDYGPVHFTGLEAYDNYDSWRSEYYGYESFTAGQIQWLQQDLAATDRLTKVLFQHYDFAGELNLGALGLDMSLSGHIHHDTEDSSAPFDISTDNAGGTNRPFRLVRFQGGQLSTQPSLEAGFDGQTLNVSYLPGNDGLHDQVTVVIDNGHDQRFEYGRVKVAMPLTAAAFAVTGGQLAQVDRTGDPAVCYIDVDIPAGGTRTVTVTVDDSASPVNLTPSSPHLLGAHPNPFNPRTEIAFDLVQRSFCRLTIFDLKGREVAVLAEGDLESGRHAFVWQGTDSLGSDLPSGVYFAGLRTGSFFETRKLTLVR